jgi:hypothetical protein
MAREKDKQPDTDGQEKKKPPSAFMAWFEEAWTGWLRPLGLLLLCLAAYLLYKFDMLNERFAGLGLVVLILGGSLTAATQPAWQMLQGKKSIERALFGLMVGAWALGAGYPSLRAVWPQPPLATIQLHAPNLLTNVADTKSTGPYEVTVAGHFRQQGAADAEASYNLTFTADGVNEDVSGTLSRSQMHLRTSRRGGTVTTVAERTEKTHRLAQIKGGRVTVSTPSLDDALSDEGLFVYIRQGGLDPIIPLALAALAVLLALFFDGRLADPKAKRTYLTTAAGLALVFSIVLPRDATPSSLVRPAVGAGVLALLIGGLGGWLLSSFVRLAVAPKTPKRK